MWLTFSHHDLFVVVVFPKQFVFIAFQEMNSSPEEYNEIIFSKVIRLLLPRTLRIAIIAASSCAAAFPGPPAQTTAAHSTRSGVAPSLPNAPADKLKLTGVPNAGKITDPLFRGAQPSAQGFAQLKKLGVTTIVNLREHGKEVEWERKVTESLGIRYINIPIRGWLPPSDAQVAQFLKLFQEAPVSACSSIASKVRTALESWSLLTESPSKIGPQIKPSARCTPSAFTTIGIPR